LKSLVDGGKVKATLPSALDAEHQKMLDDLKAKNGKDFDQSYDQIQVKAHQDAVALFNLPTPRAAMIPNSRSGRRRFPISSGTSPWRRS
jgi:predicted outer membrane protein